MDRSGQRWESTDWLLLVVLAVALGLRLWGIEYGLPHTYHADEPTVIKRALAFGTGDLNPHSFHWPAFHTYLLFGLYGVLYVAGWIGGAFESVADYRDLYFRDPTLFYLAARSVSAVMGAATVLLTYRAASVLMGTGAGVLAATVLAVLPHHVRDSHIAILDVPATFWVAASFLVSVRIFSANAPGWKLYAGAGALAGLAAATKYNAGVVVIAIGAAHFLRTARPPQTLVLGAAAAAIVAFVVATPYNLLDWPTFLRDYRYQQQHLAEGQWGLGPESAVLYYVQTSLWFHIRNTTISLFDPMPLLLAAGAIVLPFVAGWRTAALVLAVPLAYLAIISQWGMAATRYLLPAFPFLAIAVGGAFTRLPRPLLAVAVLSLLVSFRASLLMDATLSRTDTRTEAKEWIEKTVPPGTTLAVEPYTPPLAESPESIRRRISLYRRGDADHPTQSDERMIRYHRWRLEAAPPVSYDIVHFLPREVADHNRVPQQEYDLDRLRDRGVEYIVLSSQWSGRYRTERARRVYPRMNHFYDTVEEEIPLVREFRPGHFQPGPVIRIYRLAAGDSGK